MEDIKRRSLIEETIEIYQDKIKRLSVFVADLKKQEKFFRNSKDKLLYLTVKDELRIAETRKEALANSLNTMKTFLA